MAVGRITEWRKLPVSLTELCLATTLRCGQSFRWRQCDDDTWACTLRGRIIQLSQDQSPSASHIRYRSIWPNAPLETPPTPPSSHPSITGDEDPDENGDDTCAVLHHYLNLTPNLPSLYTHWSSRDANFRKRAPQFTGIRILRQPAWEALVGFICSSNNNIIRISQMVDKLCTHYGPYIGTLNAHAYHDFPPPSALTGPDVESHLRALGFGYRAKYIAQTAQMVVAQDKSLGGGDDDATWLDSLRNPEAPAYRHPAGSAGDMRPEGRAGYRAAHEALLTLQGVGPKVADCVCLMGLGWGEAVPVDTHVWQIAQRDYKFGKGKHASLTKATYDAIGEYFRALWGVEAGWAHSVLFAADLRVFEGRTRVKVEEKVEVKVEKVESESETETEAEAVGTRVTKAKTIIKKDIIRKAVVKRERDDTDDNKLASVLQLDELTVSSSERVKRRRRG